MKIRSFLTAVPGALRATGLKFAADHLSAYSAQATFYLMLAVFPFTMLVCMATRLLPFLSEETLFMLVKLLLPASFQALGTGLVDGYYNENIGSATLVLVIFLIWTASRLIQALKNGFNTSCGIVESRSQIVLRLIGCLYTVALCVILLAVIVMYALGSRLMGFILSHTPDSGVLELILKLTRNLATPVLLLGVFWLSYVFLPSRKAKFREELPGAVVTTLVWRGAASLYGVFLERSLERYSNVYGTLAGVVMILIWLYACVYVWFIGMELNCFLRECRERGMFEKLHLPLPELIRRLFRKKKHSDEA
ncbi:MAG: YihY/virulence factor BrkB family protein [Oscillospiraceae bacterium]|nr:YihY/virulence factor BrkB family protein [Oscillospiraceae bacterium]